MCNSHNHKSRRYLFSSSSEVWFWYYQRQISLTKLDLEHQIHLAIVFVSTKQSQTWFNNMIPCRPLQAMRYLRHIWHYQIWGTIRHNIKHGNPSQMYFSNDMELPSHSLKGVAIKSASNTFVFFWGFLIMLGLFRKVYYYFNPILKNKINK